MLLVTDSFDAKGYRKFEEKRRSLPTKAIKGRGCILIRTTPNPKPTGDHRLAQRLGIACAGSCTGGDCEGPSIIIIDDGDFEYFKVSCNCEGASS